MSIWFLHTSPWHAASYDVSSTLLCAQHSRILKVMEVHFPPEVEEKLEQMARATGRRTDELVKNVVADFFDDLSLTRETLDRRYDDLESGRVKAIPGDEVIARLRAKSAARRAERQ